MSDLETNRGLIPKSTEQLMLALYEERRQASIKAECSKHFGKRSQGTLPDEKHPRCKYTNVQITSVRAFLAANKRVEGRGLAWKLIGAKYGVPFATVRKCAQMVVLPHGKIYRPSCIPTEAQILAAVADIKAGKKAVADRKYERTSAKLVARAAQYNVENLAEATAVSKALSEAEQFAEYCRLAGVHPQPKTLAGISDAMTTIIDYAGDDIPMTELHKAMTAAIAAVA